MVIINVGIKLIQVIYHLLFLVSYLLNIFFCEDTHEVLSA